MHRRGSARFDIVLEADLPPGRYCSMAEINTQIIFRFLKGEVTEALTEQLTRWSDHILDKGLWVKHDDADDRPPAVPDARFQIVPAGALPGGQACYPIEAPGEFIWQISEAHMSQRLCDQLNEELARTIREGDWAPLS